MRYLNPIISTITIYINEPNTPIKRVMLSDYMKSKSLVNIVFKKYTENIKTQIV